MGEDIGRGTLRDEAADAAVGGWDNQAVAELRGAVYRADGPAVVEALRGWPLHVILQMAGDGLLSALAQEVPDARELAAPCAKLLRERRNAGDEELADQLEASMGRRPTPMLRPVPVDLDELSSMLEGDPSLGDGRLDLETGETWPTGAEDVWREEDGADEDNDEDRWLWVESMGSKDGYGDMEVFIATVSDHRRREMLEVAITGRGAFRRFKDVLARWPGELDRWYLFSEERCRGRARAWLADEGYRPAARGQPSAS